MGGRDRGQISVERSDLARLYCSKDKVAMRQTGDGLFKPMNRLGDEQLRKGVELCKKFEMYRWEIAGSGFLRHPTTQQA